MFFKNSHKKKKPDAFMVFRGAKIVKAIKCARVGKIRWQAKLQLTILTTTTQQQQQQQQ